jgi:hypothetical protein
MQRAELVGRNHLSFVNEKTIQIFRLYLISQKLLDDLKKVGYMEIHEDRHDSHYIQR